MPSTLTHKWERVGGAQDAGRDNCARGEGGQGCGAETAQLRELSPRNNVLHEFSGGDGNFPCNLGQLHDIKQSGICLISDLKNMRIKDRPFSFRRSLSIPVFPSRNWSLNLVRNRW